MSYNPCHQSHGMIWTKRNRDEHRYYLLPGMGRSNRRQHRLFLVWALIVGLLVSSLFACFLYVLSGLHW
jgi:hypothetical protein